MILQGDRSSGSGSGSIVALAPAKLNLFLEVLGQRDDGYHELETVMVATDLYDRLGFVPAPDQADPIVLDCDDPSLPVDEGNLVVRAAIKLHRYAESLGRSVVPVRMSLHKAIPAQAGLGGGSSDAAATLRALDRLWNLDLEQATLHHLAGTIGSDVPFLLGGSAGLCHGRGERVTLLALGQTLHFVMVCPNFGMSTPEVYGQVRISERPQTSQTLINALASTGSGPALGQALFNRLQEAAERLRPELVTVRQALERLMPSHFDGVALSGSGSAYFGLSRSRQAAQEAVTLLEGQQPGSVRLLSSSP